MKKIVLFFLVLTLFGNVLMSQTLEQIRQEAFPTENYVDNSPYAQLWSQTLEARRSGNIELYNSLTARINAEYPDKFVSCKNVPLSLIMSSSDNWKPPFLPSEPDWGTGDVRVAFGSIASGTPGNPRPNYKTIRFAADTNGVLFAGYINGSRDTLNFYRSTNYGLNWSRIIFYYAAPGAKFHSFDFFVTDTVNTFKIGCATSVTTMGAGFDGSLYWLSFNADGTNPRSSLIKGKVDGKGYVGASVMSDGYKWTPNLTYWYVAYQQLDTVTGVTNVALLSLSTDWGGSWITDTARSTYNDYELDVDYNSFASSDTVYVNLTNNLTASNENMRLRYCPLSGIGTATTWKQFNTAQTTDPEYCGSLAVNRQTNEMGVSYTRSTTSVENINYCYALTGTYPWVSDVALTSGASNENLSSLKCQESQGAFRIVYHVAGGSFDTIVYKSTFSLGNSFQGHQVVNLTNNASATSAPDVFGFRSAVSSFSGGVIFVHSSGSGLWYDGSNISPTSINKNGNTVKGFELYQNYPNPFNPSTTIKFSVPEKSSVSLKVFDVTGKEVANLFYGELSQGSYEFIFNASELTSGIYFYKMVSGNFTDTKKMMVLK